MNTSALNVPPSSPLWLVALFVACTPLVGSPDAYTDGAPCTGRSSTYGGVVEAEPLRNAVATPEVGLHAMGLDRAGSVYLLGSWVLNSDGDEEALVVRLRGDGTVDAGFGDGGRVRVRPAGPQGYTQFLAMAEDAAGRLLPDAQPLGSDTVSWTQTNFRTL